MQGVTAAFNNLTNLIDAIPLRASLNSGLHKLFLYLNAANSIVKGTILTSGYSKAAEVKIIIIIIIIVH